MAKVKKKDRIDTEIDFIDDPKHGNSLRTLMEAYPEGVSDKTICRVLHLTEEELDMAYTRILVKLKKDLK